VIPSTKRLGFGFAWIGFGIFALVVGAILVVCAVGWLIFGAILSKYLFGVATTMDVDFVLYATVRNIAVGFFMHKIYRFCHDQAIQESKTKSWEVVAGDLQERSRIDRWHTYLNATGLCAFLAAFCLLFVGLATSAKEAAEFWTISFGTLLLPAISGVRSGFKSAS
jgi:hypothetical protein